jgi:hypothetical protein
VVAVYNNQPVAAKRLVTEGAAVKGVLKVRT